MKNRIMKVLVVMLITTVTMSLLPVWGGRTGRGVEAKADVSTVSFDETTGTLTLKKGNVIKDDVTAFKDDSRVQRVEAEAGAVLPADCSGLFEQFNALVIDLRGADTSRVTDMSEMFSECRALRTL
ncbi:MAG: BspA family leucine-rich repeat surface protein, partial [Lachnospiraceae bacterium]|nr:BspA family leucine-rich repeat surface protein [Lachnospiraceae bacterium]